MLITNLFSSVQTLLPFKQKTFRIKLDKINKHRIKFIFMNSRRLQMTNWLKVKTNINVFWYGKKTQSWMALSFMIMNWILFNNQIGNLILEYLGYYNT